MDTTVIALSREDAGKFRSSEPYVIVSIRDVCDKRAFFFKHKAFRGQMTVFFDDVTPDECFRNGDRIWFEMDPEHADRIVRFAQSWWGKVATIVVHCNAGHCRSTAVAATIAEHHGQSVGSFFTPPRRPNTHVFRLMREAFARHTASLCEEQCNESA